MNKSEELLIRRLMDCYNTFDKCLNILGGAANVRDLRLLEQLAYNRESILKDLKTLEPEDDN